MKKFSILFSLLFTCSLHVYADCNIDVLQMKDQISKFDSITTKDGIYRFEKIGGNLVTLKDNFCTVSVTSAMPAIDASGIHYYKDCSKITWKIGNWDDTFTCA